MKCVVKLVWDDESNAWFTETNDIPGLHLNSLTFDNLVEKVRLAAPEMLEANLDYTGPVHISFEAERIITKRNVSVDGKIYPRHTANGILKDAGISTRFR